MTLLTHTKRLLTENLALKATALALAFLMWMTLTSDQPVEKVVSVRLEYLHIPEGLEISSQQAGLLDLHIRVPGRRSGMSDADLRVMVDLKDATPGRKIIHLDPLKNVIRPAGVEVLKLSPPRLTLFLERSVQAAIPVEPTIEGAPPPGFEVAGVQVTPAKVLIAGPESHVRSAAVARTETVSIQGRSTLVNVWVNITVEDPAIRILDTKPVQVTVEIRERRREVWVTGVRVRPEPEDPARRLQPASVRVRVSVPHSLRQELTPDMFLGVATLGDPDPGGGRQTAGPKVELTQAAPPDVRILEIQPATLEVITSRKKRSSDTTR